MALWDGITHLQVSPLYVKCGLHVGDCDEETQDIRKVTCLKCLGIQNEKTDKKKEGNDFIHFSNGASITCGYGGLRFANFKRIPYPITEFVDEVTCPDCLTIINIWKKNGN